MRACGQYLRISDDPALKRLGVQRQRDETTAKVAALGWRIVETYEDNDRSASDPSKPRPAFARMLRDIATGRIDAVVVWDQDRLLRLPREGEDFLDLVEKYGTALASVGGDVDLATDNGRLFFRIKVAVSRAEMERKSARQKSANRQRAQRGGPPGGRRPFGYTANWSELVDDEAREVKAAADKLLAGSSLRSVVADWNARGIKTTFDGPWRPTQLRRLLLSPRNAGISMYHGEPFGQGTWPAIFDEGTLYGLRAYFADPERHKAGPPRKYLLSGIAVCWCDQRVYGTAEKRKGYRYRCESRRHVSVLAEPIEEEVLDRLAQRLKRDDAIDLFTREQDQDEVDSLKTEASKIRKRMQWLAKAFAAETIEEDQLVEGTEDLRVRLASVTAKLDATAQSPDVADLVRSDDVEATVQAWYDDDIDRLRSVLRVVTTAIVLDSPGQGARYFRPETVKVKWRRSARRPGRS